jgi:hypothetical protein
MFEFLGGNKSKAEAIVIFLVLFIISVFGVPMFKDDLDKPMLINVVTKEQVHYKILTEVFIIALLISGIAPLLYLSTKAEQLISRRRSIVEVWKDISENDRIKLGLPHISDKKFSEDTILYTQDDVYSIIRYPSYDQGKYFYLVLDMKEDWNKRSTTPIHSFALTNMGLDRAKAILGKKGEPLERFIGQAQKIGLSPEELRRQILERQIIADEARKRTEFPVAGEVE